MKVKANAEKKTNTNQYLLFHLDFTKLLGLLQAK